MNFYSNTILTSNLSQRHSNFVLGHDEKKGCLVSFVLLSAWISGIHVLFRDVTKMSNYPILGVKVR